MPSKQVTFRYNKQKKQNAQKTGKKCKAERTHLEKFQIDIIS